MGIHKTIPREFNPGDDVVQEFGQYLEKQNVHASEQDLKDNQDFIKRNLRLELIAMIYGDDEAKRIKVEDDPLVEKGLGSLPQAQDLVARAKKYVASKGHVSQ